MFFGVCLEFKNITISIIFAHNFFLKCKYIGLVGKWNRTEIFRFSTIRFWKIRFDFGLKKNFGLNFNLEVLFGLVHQTERCTPLFFSWSQSPLHHIYCIIGHKSNIWQHIFDWSVTLALIEMCRLYRWNVTWDLTEKREIKCELALTKT